MNSLLNEPHLVVFVVRLLALLVLDAITLVVSAPDARSGLGLLESGRIANVALETTGPVDISASWETID